MATAVCGLVSTSSNNKSVKTHREQRRKTKDSKRRQAALLFLNNISLDGRPQCQPSDENDQKAAEEQRLRDRDGGATVVPLPADTQEPVAQVTEPAATGSGSSSSGPGVVSPTRPSFVMSPGLAGANEVFLEGGSAAEALTPDTPLSPVPTGHQPCSRARSTPAALSPVPTGNSMDSRQRLRNVSGSPGPKVPKKVHFIKSMRQYDTRGCRIVLICAKRSLYAAFSVLPYGERAHPGDKEAHPQKRENPPSLLCFYHRGLIISLIERGVNSIATVIHADTSHFCTTGLISFFLSLQTTVVEYVKPSDLKKDMNETFKEKFPHIKLTLSKIRSLKREMGAMSEDCGLQPVTIAMAFVYFEKLVLKGRLNKHNRKLVAAACVLLAAKISSDLRKPDVKHLIDKLEERFRINRRELIPLEFPVLVALEMGLYLPESKVMPHYRRLVQQG
ncbi:CDK5 and ABL1 enzyme substrate 1 [Etheostoma spectabile]|uniref:CDK5 and ABL1 enzyme substrate 1 n=1 Tax=Etheostoma spectabile TaxID=54343 RepID=UPI0013AFCF08|nr:CDK5 and ABL1 enzyme substrate 1-like [Etheostoma spectabile]